MKKILLKFLAFFTVLTPSLVYAQGQGFGTLTRLIDQIALIVQKLIPIVFGLAILGFFWGLVKYIFSQGNEESKTEGKKVMLWALVALFVMVSVFGIIRLAQDTFEIKNNNPFPPPDINLRR